MNGISAGRLPDRGGRADRQEAAPGDREVGGVVVCASAPLASTSQIALVLTPPAVNQRPPPTVFGDLASLDRHRGEVHVGALVAVGLRVRDVVGDGRELVGIRVQPGHAGVQRRGNTHAQSFVREGSAASLARHSWRPGLKNPLMPRSHAFHGSKRRSSVISTRRLRESRGSSDDRAAVGLAGHPRHPRVRDAGRLEEAPGSAAPGPTRAARGPARRGRRRPPRGAR